MFILIRVLQLLRITEDLMERTALEEGQQFGKSIGKIYLKKVRNVFLSD